jgi:hypothetical protein
MLPCLQGGHEGEVSCRAGVDAVICLLGVREAAAEPVHLCMATKEDIKQHAGQTGGAGLGPG